MRKKVLAAISAVFLSFFVISVYNVKDADALSIDELPNQVINAGTFNDYEYPAVNDIFEGYYGGLPAACSATAKVTSDGKTIVGRNLDLTLSNRAIFLLKTDFSGMYKTMGLCYSTDFGSYYNSIVKNGISEDLQKQLPWMCEDVMNSQGLYAEVNMCYDEVDSSGAHFACSGTNPSSSERVCCLALPQMLCTHCANIDEAISYAKSLDIYSLNTPYYSWCLNSFLADASGRYGVLQIAENQVTWVEGKQILTNAFPYQSTYDKQKYKSGIGRYDHISKNIANVNSESQMMQLMKDVSYGHMYDATEPPFEMYSEFVYTYDEWTYDYVMNNKSKVKSYWNNAVNYRKSLSYQKQKDYELFWISIYNVVANCNDKTFNIRFFEDDTQTYTFSLFDENN